MKLIRATYGNVDCSSVVSSKIRNNSLIIRADNSIIGDPRPGTVKQLVVELEHEGTVVTKAVNEGEMLIYPKSTTDRLGVFYSNNNEPSIYPAIRASLQSIKRAAEGKADILTCMWNSEPSNPFTEYIAWTKTSSHLNQLLQVMQLLYNARQINNYKYVSFLEHDVLYPEGYFDYPEFPEGEMYTNMNYIGINNKGFQPRQQNDEPFHQITMRFSDAVKHCESILANALVTNSGLIEPQDIKRKQWNCINPSIHINHGKHFTSHFSIYKSTGLYYVDPYWGNHSDYLNLFP